MNRSFLNRLWPLGALVAALGVAAPTWADPLSAVEVLREGGCGGIMPAARPLRRNPLLDRAAVEWALGQSLPAASMHNGIPANVTAGVHISGPDSSALQLLRQTSCRIVAGREMRDVGVYRRGFDTWIVVASIYRLPPGMTASSGTWVPASPPPQVISPPVPSSPPPVATTGRVLSSPPPDDWDAGAAPAPARAVSKPTAGALALAPTMANRALQLVNEVRARGTHCGDELFGPAPAMTLSGTLADVALGHANDMAERNYFEHVDPSGHSPADRVRASGYQEQLVGENIAYGPQSVEEVVQGWLNSPGHCENIMDPRFTEMGIALAPGQAKRGLYWVQVFAEPRAGSARRASPNLNRETG